MIRKFELWLCKIGVHRPLRYEECLFVDFVSGKEIHKATCPCGKEWLSDSFNGWFGRRMERK